MKILKKILDEINKEKPRLDYIRGLIEASVEDEEFKFNGIAGSVYPTPVINRAEVNIKSDDEPIPEFLKPGPIGKLNS